MTKNIFSLSLSLSLLLNNCAVFYIKLPPPNSAGPLVFFVCFVVEIVLYVLKGGDIITGLNPFVSALKQNELQIEKKLR